MYDIKLCNVLKILIYLYTKLTKTQHLFTEILLTFSFNGGGSFNLRWHFDYFPKEFFQYNSSRGFVTIVTFQFL